MTCDGTATAAIEFRFSSPEAINQPKQFSPDTLGCDGAYGADDAANEPSRVLWRLGIARAEFEPKWFLIN